MDEASADRGRRSADGRIRRRESAVVAAAALAVVAFATWEIGNPDTKGAAGNVLSFLLVNLNIVLLLLVMFLVVRNVLRLVLERRRGIVGSHLRSRLVMAFVTLSLFPAVLMVVVSYEFVNNSIDNWLGRQVEESLDGAYRVARAHYKHLADAAVGHARAVALEIRQRDLLEGNEGALLRAVGERQRLHALATVEIFDRRGQPVLAVFRGQKTATEKPSPNAEWLATVLSGETVSRIESRGATDLVRGAAPLLGADGQVLGAVVVDTVVAENPRAWSAQILDSFREFRRLKLSKQPFKNLYLLTMLLASAVVVFSATWLGLYLARGITEPIGRLAEAARDVAGGRLDVALPEEGGDEVGTLVRTFNAMTAQLKRGRDALEERRVYIESVLANIGAGVVSIDADGRVGTVNPAAIALLGLDHATVVGRSAEAVFREAGHPEVVGLLGDVRAGRAVAGTSITLRADHEAPTLLATATRLEHGAAPSSGSVLFFEDVSQIQEVQRMEAWREVARRIAHEIKNPLTPIQLSAQRLGRRLAGQLEARDEELVAECVNTIVSEVDGLKKLVNEFSSFARMGVGDRTVQDLNPVVEETLPLYRQGHPEIPIEFVKAPSLPPVRIDRDAVRRSLVNLLDNAVAALSQVEDEPRRIVVTTRFEDPLARVVLEVADTGPGIPRAHRARIFEPYFSTKSEGTGLGLAIVASMATSHRAYLRVRANEPRGTRFVIEFPATHGQHRA